MRVRGGSGEGEKARAEEVRESVASGRTEEDGRMEGRETAGAVGALLFAVEGGGSWGRKGGRRIDPDGAWLTADEAVTRDESRRDGRRSPPSLLRIPLFRPPASGGASWRDEARQGEVRQG